MRTPLIYKILFIIILLTLSGLSYSFAVSGNNFIPIMDYTGKEVVSISATGNDQETSFTVQSGKIMTVKNASVMDSPPRIIYDIPYDGASFRSIENALKYSNIKSIRAGYHSGNIRIVLDINGASIPKFSHRVSKHELIILVATDKKSDGKEVKAKENGRQNKTIASGISLSENNNLTNSTKDLSENNPKGNEETVAQKPEPENIVPEKKPQIDPGKLLLEKMTELEPNDGSEEAALFLSGANAFKDSHFKESVDSLNNLIQSYPKGKYSEKAHFLLAKSFDRLYAKTSSDYFSVIKNSYDDAIYKFPSSAFTPDALLSAGNLCLKTNNIGEAMAYYNRVIEKHISPHTTVRALLNKGEALFQKGKYPEALSIYEIIIQAHNTDSGNTEAELGIAKTLFEMNSFQKSMALLNKLGQNHENIYRYPDIALYLGYNYYQLGNYNAATKNLFEYYNIYPDSKVNHLVLSKIGDAYRADKLSESASKIYMLVFEQFPHTEGAQISLTRLAEQQENGELKNGNNFISPATIENDLSSPRKIYEKITSEYLSKDNKNPMLEYTRLKLALIYQKEKNYKKSMQVLESLLHNYPLSKLYPEIIYALTDNIEAILKDRKNDEDDKEAYIDVVNMYLRKKNIIKRLAPPKTLIAIASACIRLGLEATAAELFLQAESVLPEKEKPGKLFYYLGKYYFENGQQEKGLKKLDSLTAQYQSGEFVAKAYSFKGIFFEKNKKYEQAIEMFSQALKSEPEVEDRIMLLADKARVLAASGLNNDSLKSALEAEQLLSANPKQPQFVYLKVGEIFLHLGKPEDALLLFNNALTLKKDAIENMKIRYLAAQCYEALNRKSDYISAYNRIAKSGDPLWSKLANERLEAIMFKELLSKRDRVK